MASYFFFDVVGVKDQKKMEKYRSGVLATVDKYEGRYILIGGPLESVEGSWKPAFPVIIEFPDQLKARQWYTSAEYAPLKTLRMEAAEVNAVFMQGL